uniref:Uncharacterized protein n=1 Tax=Medicago truncatula TaxID=3880 RepID=A2Q1K4_MEDTR|nr:hypothetical protein MtrDRAFT_AC148918g22v2 [Medicago truncatula]
MENDIMKKKQMTSQSQDSLRLHCKVIRQNSRSSDSSTTKIYFRTTRICKFFCDFSRSKMSLPPSSITRYLPKLNHCPPKLMSNLEPDQLLHIFGLSLTTKWKQRTQGK